MSYHYYHYFLVLVEQKYRISDFFLNNLFLNAKLLIIHCWYYYLFSCWFGKRKQMMNRFLVRVYVVNNSLQVKNKNIHFVKIKLLSWPCWIQITSFAFPNPFASSCKHSWRSSRQQHCELGCHPHRIESINRFET